MRFISSVPHISFLHRHLHLQSSQSLRCVELNSALYIFSDTFCAVQCPPPLQKKRGRAIPPLQKKTDRPPTPRLSAGQAPTPLRLHSHGRVFAWSSRRSGSFRSRKTRGGWEPLECPEGVPPPPPLKKRRGHAIPPLQKKSDRPPTPRLSSRQAPTPPYASI